jgi:hypothetical protein
MHVAALLLGLVFLAVVLLDAFQTIILPRRPVGRLRITRLFFLFTWGPWAFFARRFRSPRVREQLYSTYGPLSLLLLFFLWAALLVVAFAGITFGMHTPFSDPYHPNTPVGRLLTCLYVSGTTLFTLGLGDVLPTTQAARLIMVLEGGFGLGYVALVIGYVPVLYMAFSDREIAIALLDGRAGSPPTAAELLLRHNFSGGNRALNVLLADWERWCATMLETHISYPILCYYRSQHDNQSWLAGLTAILDTCALLITTIEGPATRQAQLTFAAGRHTLVDLGHVFHQEDREREIASRPLTRLSDEDFARLCNALRPAGFSLCRDIDAPARLTAIRLLYEPHALAMAERLCFDLPRWIAPPRDPARKPDIWTSVANLRSPGAVTDGLSSHVSSQATSSQLDETDWHL